MTDTYKVLGQVLAGDLAVDNSTVKEVLAYEVPSGTKASISAIEITNSSDNTQTYNLSFVKNEEKDSASTTLTLLLNENVAVVGGISVSDQNPSFNGPGVTFRSIAYGNNVYVGVAPGATTGYVGVSSDGIIWTISTLSHSSNSVRFNNNTFVIYDGYTRYESLDGVDWTEYTQTKPIDDAIFTGSMYVGYGFVGFSNSDTGTYYSYDNSTWSQSSTEVLQKIQFQNGVFVAHSLGNSRYYYSSSGTSWTMGSFQISGLASANGIFVAYGYYGGTSISTNGSTWSSSTAPSSPSFNIVYANDVYVLASSYTLYYSTDFNTWTEVKTLAFDQTSTTDRIQFLIFDGNKFVVSYFCGTGYSQDGSNWNFNVLPSSFDSIAYGNNTIIMASSDPGSTMISSDYGSSWQNSSQYLRSVAFGNNIFVGLNNSSPYNTCSVSLDGQSWSTYTLPFSNAQKIVFSNDRFVAIGNAGPFWSIDGINWNESSTDIDGLTSAREIKFVNDRLVATGFLSHGVSTDNGVSWIVNNMLNFYDVVYGAGKYIANSYTEIGISNDAITWEYTTLGESYYYNNAKISYGNGVFVLVIQDFQQGKIKTSTDGVNWSDTGFSSLTDYFEPRSLYFSEGNFILIERTESNIIDDGKTWYSVDGLTWTLSAKSDISRFSGNIPVPTDELTLQSLNKHKVINAKSIDSGQTHEIKGGITLSAGDQVRVYSDSSDIITNVYGVEIA